MWPTPSISEDILDEYRQVNTQSKYSIEDHPNLSGGAIRELFEELRKQIVSLDSVVTEEFLKLYVAYKAETNFVDVVPQAKRLRLSLNIPFYELNDSRQVAKDVSDIGRWGNGDVEVGLASIEEIPYTMSLIRQAFDYQMSKDSL